MMTTFLDPNTWLLVMAYLGVAAGAVSGVMAAQREDMDLVGALAVAMITALGGGTLRDMLLGRTPVFWISEQGYVFAALGVAVITFASSRLLRLAARSIVLPDAIGLGVFSIWGAAYSLLSGTSLFIAAMMGVVTGVFGGVLRDVICNRIPYVFGREATLYATCSFVGAWVYLILLRYTELLPVLAVFVGVLVIVSLRMIAVRFDLRLPHPDTNSKRRE
jgi:uncharacterized membrane protein YeiH